MKPLALSLGFALWACSTSCSTSTSGPSAEEKSAIAIDTSGAVVKSGPIGFTDRSPGSYVLVDATNKSDKDRLVTVDAQLVDASGKALAPLSGVPLRIPAGQARTFALVADHVFPDAHGITAAVRGAPVVDYPPQVAVESPGFAPVQEYTVATASARNVIDKNETATLVATFYDTGGKILSRPAVIVELPAGASRSLRFEGPKEATRAVIYVAEVVFPQ